ncbi:YceI family protein [Streptomyces rishiriensis]|uniref:Polyisoprenoid-binding protein YceI n=1 Tax=Streptomyces rishiriensis TaxID=68264 RepID=A0ABU0NXW5_STRRH|nr:YceI family protein [Streptomyces rishiriensis]MDQ0583991.1 polyisoprenoid-binding protein YceI [Streptomyces rishiriensis]
MTVAVETGLWQLDASASTVALKHKSVWGLVTVKGVFATVNGGGEVAADGTVSGTLVLDAASVDTKNAKRDTHLRSADFFDVETYPEITFAVRAAELGADRSVKVSGQLTVRGVSRPQDFTARLSQVDADAVTLDATFTVDRNEFGITLNQLGMMGGLTTITTTLRFTRTAA